MRTYTIGITNNNKDTLIQLNAKAGSLRLSFEFVWDTIMQQHYDDAMELLEQKQENTPTRTLYDSTITENTDYGTYINTLCTASLYAFDAFRIASLEALDELDWTLLATMCNDYIEGLQRVAVSVAQFNNMLDLAEHLSKLLIIYSSQDVEQARAALNYYPEALCNYARSMLEEYNIIEAQLEDTKAQLNWLCTVTYNEEVRNFIIRRGAIYFIDDTIYQLWFEFPDNNTEVGFNLQADLYVGVKNAAG